MKHLTTLALLLIAPAAMSAQPPCIPAVADQVTLMI